MADKADEKKPQGKAFVADKALDKKTDKRTDKSAKAAPAKGFGKFLAGVRAIPRRIQKSVMSTVYELKKVTWPTRKELINYSVVVLVFIALLGVLVGLLDLGASAFIRLIIEA